PQALLRLSAVPSDRVISRWLPYQAFDPAIVVKRLRAALQPPDSVSLWVSANRIFAIGEAPSGWLESARTAASQLPAGAPDLDLSQVKSSDAAEIAAWEAAIRRLRAEPGIVVTEAQRSGDGRYAVSGLRDPLAIDPEAVLSRTGIATARID